MTCFIEDLPNEAIDARFGPTYVFSQDFNLHDNVAEKTYFFLGHAG